MSTSIFLRRIVSHWGEGETVHNNSPLAGPSSSCRLFPQTHTTHTKSSLNQKKIKKEQLKRREKRKLKLKNQTTKGKWCFSLGPTVPVHLPIQLRLNGTRPTQRIGIGRTHDIVCVYMACPNGVIDNHDPCYYCEKRNWDRRMRRRIITPCCASSQRKGREGIHLSGGQSKNHHSDWKWDFFLFSFFSLKSRRRRRTNEKRPFRAADRFVCFKDRLNERFLFPSSLLFSSSLLFTSRLISLVVILWRPFFTPWWRWWRRVTHMRTGVTHGRPLPFYPTWFF